MAPNNFMQKFINTHTVSPDAVEHFKATWLSPYLQNPLYETVPTFSRVLKPTGEDYFFSTTIRTERTIPHLISLKLKNLVGPEKVEKGHASNKTTHLSAKTQTGLSAPVPENPDCVYLIRLGKGGLDGHPSTVHGGMLCAILDETMGLTVMLHHTKDSPDPDQRESLYTVKLDTTYRAAVPTPSDVLVKSWVTRREGRKFFSRGQICNQEGMVMTEAEGLWVESKKKPDVAAKEGRSSKAAKL
jgi:acyl-coenzyme A thioesterase PaaI-like protein